MRTFPALSYHNFPSIWDTIIDGADDATKLNLRLVCYSLRAAVDRRLCGDELDWRVKSGVIVVKPSWDVVDNAMTLPFFSPYSLEGNESQLHAVRKARFVQICTPARPWINRLLQAALQPDSHVVVYHDDETAFLGGQVISNAPFHLPRCCSLNVVLDYPCPCQDQALEGQWKHSAEYLQISLFILERADLSSEENKCSVLPQLFTTSLRSLTLELRGEIEALKSASRRILFTHDMCHLELDEIAVRVYVHTDCEDEDSLAEEIERELVDVGFAVDLISVSVADRDWV